MASNPVDRLVSWFVTNAPLYHVVEVPHEWAGDEDASKILPKQVKKPCDRCGLEDIYWERIEAYGRPRSLNKATYRCRNCEESSVTIFYWWYYRTGKTYFEKVGQYPKFDINPPKELTLALEKRQLDLYRKGMTLRQHNFGLGALVYFRRLVEDSTGELLDLLEQAIIESGGDPEALKKLGDARTAGRFEDRVRAAAEALPQHLRPGGENPLGLLYQLLSDGIHAQTDEDAIKIIDDMNEVIQYLFSELKAHTAKRRSYAEALKHLTTRRESIKKKSS